MSIIHNNASSSEKVRLSHQIHLFRTVFTCKQCLICAYILDNFSLQKVILWIQDSETRSNGLKLKILDLFLTIMLFTSQDVNWWTGVVWITCGLLWWFYQLFGLSFWRHPFTAEDPLVSKWYNAKFLQIWKKKKKLIYILDVLMVSKYLSHFHFWVNYSFKTRVRGLFLSVVLLTKTIKNHFRSLT